MEKVRLSKKLLNQEIEEGNKKDKIIARIMQAMKFKELKDR